jgi:MarR family transcriptional regulator, negative regulator of the multidrug operon emrRAB
MHTESTEPETVRLANLLGALALEGAGALDSATAPVVGQAGAAAAALVTIAAHPGRTIEQLRAPLGLSQPGAVRLVERLADAGWVDRTGPGGRRGFALDLTDRGRTVLGELLAARRAALAELLEPLTPRERTQLTGLLEKLLAARSGNRSDLERLCRLCEWEICDSCPVAGAVT